MTSPTRAYPTLGAVKPHVRECALDVGNRFDVSVIHGVGARGNISDHPTGFALDFMVPVDSPVGDAIVGYLRQNWQRYNVKYVIWKRRIDDGGGYESMEDRGSITANHRDHVHVSFKLAGNGGAYAGGSYDSGAGGTITNGAVIEDYPWNFLGEQETWVRVLMYVAGIIALGYFVWGVIQ